MKKFILVAITLSSASILGCAAIGTDTASDGSADYRSQAIALMKSSFHDKDQATMDRLDQDGVQRVCDRQPDTPARAQERAALEKAELAV